VNGGQGFAFGVGVETDILGSPFITRGLPGDVTGIGPMSGENSVLGQDEVLPFLISAR
jgi:hypothetical protein